MLSRRSFLGSVLGTVAGVPFLARLSDEPAQLASASPYRLLFRDSRTGYVVQAPPLAKIVETEEGYAFIAAPLEVTRAMTADQSVLLDEAGVIAGPTFFPEGPARVINGDTLTVGHGLAIHGVPKGATVEEFVRLYRKHKRVA